MSFKSVSRYELDRLKGPRPLYEEIFMNDFNNYNVKYPDPKVHGNANFAPKQVKARDSKPNKICRHGLTKLAEITLHVRDKSINSDNDYAGPNLKNRKRSHARKHSIMQMNEGIYSSPTRYDSEYKNYDIPSVETTHRGG